MTERKLERLAGAGWLATRTGARASLPRPVISYVRRDDEVPAAPQVVRAACHVTLTGPGAVGKTRRVVEVATYLAGDSPDGVWFCDLAAVGNAATVPSAGGPHVRGPLAAWPPAAPS
jgi:hypothetical protein